MTMHRRTFLAASAAVAAAPAVARAEAGWTPRASMSWPTQEIYCAALNGEITVAGGLVRSATGGLHINDRTAVYDVKADRWSEGPRLPQPRHHPMLAAAAGRIWAFGGYDRRDGGEWTAMTDIWAIDRGVWAQVGQMPERLCETVGLSLGDRVHLITGRSPKGEANGQWNDQGDVATHLVFDAAANRWDAARPAPMARNSAAGAVLDGKLFVAGGRTVDGGGTGRLDRYDPASDRWDTLAPIPASPATGKQVGGGLAMAETGGRLVAFGGEWFDRPGGGVFAETWLYDPARDAWTAGPAMRTPRHGLAAASVDGTVYAIGGGEVVSGGKASSLVEALSL
ncbi:Kelch repeat-containing protein [Brevundimonas guildfordensis]|uniref:Galactose oxidase n=1 Tax=Brevundimonas guildfordensis TaxID=2762241 RepID=A0ABR8QYE3_9CAUL|nr:kelch repeat-containing protein [Brevundimonas guildfordensis]MBD7940267.1 galactose oxidase [Brevundimonas guildfordensis]